MGGVRPLLLICSPLADVFRDDADGRVAQSSEVSHFLHRVLMDSNGFVKAVSREVLSSFTSVPDEGIRTTVDA